MDKHQEHGEQEAEVADAVHDERFLARRGGVLLVVVETDQQVGAESDSFPSHEDEEVAAAQNENGARKRTILF